MHIHLLRALRPTVVQTWANDIDTLVREAFSRITDIAVSLQDEAFYYPPAEAGLGFTSLRREAATHYVAQLLADRHSSQDAAYVWSGQSEISRLSTFSSLPRVLAYPKRVLPLRQNWHTGASAKL
eukprot:1002570-Amphidinium_carterae.1